MLDSRGWMEYFYYKRLAKREKALQEHRDLLAREQALLEDIQRTVQRQKAA